MATSSSLRQPAKHWSQAAAQAVHAARRDSHRKLAYLRWHLASMLRYFTTRYFAARY